MERETKGAKPVYAALSIRGTEPERAYDIIESYLEHFYSTARCEQERRLVAAKNSRTDKHGSFVWYNQLREGEGLLAGTVNVKHLGDCLDTKLSEVAPSVVRQRFILYFDMAKAPEANYRVSEGNVNITRSMQERDRFLAWLAQQR